jgi:hypothetical protein
MLTHTRLQGSLAGADEPLHRAQEVPRPPRCLYVRAGQQQCRDAPPVRVTGAEGPCGGSDLRGYSENTPGQCWHAGGSYWCDMCPFTTYASADRDLSSNVVWIAARDAGWTPNTSSLDAQLTNHTFSSGEGSGYEDSVVAQHHAAVAATISAAVAEERQRHETASRWVGAHWLLSCSAVTRNEIFARGCTLSRPLTTGTLPLGSEQRLAAQHQLDEAVRAASDRTAQQLQASHEAAMKALRDAATTELDEAVRTARESTQRQAHTDHERVRQQEHADHESALKAVREEIAVELGRRHEAAIGAAREEFATELECAQRLAQQQQAIAKRDNEQLKARHEAAMAAVRVEGAAKLQREVRAERESVMRLCDVKVRSLSIHPTIISISISIFTSSPIPTISKFCGS